MKKKNSIYQKYIAQLEKTVKEGYYFEAAWLEYVLMEDRLTSLLRNSGGVNKIKMMGPKIVELNSRMANNANLRGNLNRLLDHLNVWKDERNILMHSMANGSLSIKEIELKVERVARTGISLVRDFASAARRVKRNKKTK